MLFFKLSSDIYIQLKYLMKYTNVDTIYIGEMIKNMLTRKKESYTYLTDHDKNR
jgi:hypothetical protein